MKRLILSGMLLSSAALAAQQAMPTDAWPSYNGDYTGRRFSTLTKVNEKNVQHLSLAWSYRLSVPGAGPIKGTPLMLNGVLYLTAPDHVWAIDARTSREIWHWENKSVGGIPIGNRGVAIKGDNLYVETRDCNLVSLTIKDGKERWRKNICNLDQYYYASVAPIVVGTHVITGVSGDDLDVPGYLESHDAETGEREWRWYVVPQKADDPGIESWPNLEAAQHGGGMTWQPVTYDPELNLIYVTTGNPQPVVAYANRAGDNLFTASIVALNPDNGKMKWYFQSSPHDTHDWDATQTPVLFDGEISGQPHKMLAQASRNGKFYRPRSCDREGARLVRFRSHQLVEGLQRRTDSRFPIPTRTRKSPARSSRPTREARPTGRRRRSARRPACSTSARRRPTASGTSTIPATTPRAGAAPIAAAGRSTWCRPSTTRPAGSAGAISGKGAACRAS